MEEKDKIKKEKPGLIFEKISAIMADIKAIKKDRKGEGVPYKFRGIDDVYNELHAILTEHQVFTVPEVLTEKYVERKSMKGNLLIYRMLTIQYTFFTTDGSHIVAVIAGEGMDTGDKAGHKAQSMAHKIALLQIFCIPTKEAKDAENEDYQLNGDVEYKRDRASEAIVEMADDGDRKIVYPKDITLTQIDGSKVKVDKFEALGRFQTIKKTIGEKEYYKILDANSYEKSNQIPKKDIPKVYAQMVEAYNG